MIGEINCKTEAGETYTIYDLTSPEAQEDYIKDCLDESVVEKIKIAEAKYKVKAFVGMFYAKGQTLETLKQDLKPMDPKSEFIGPHYPSATYLVNDIPTGKYHFISNFDLNWPIFGDNYPPDCKSVGFLDWNREKRKLSGDMVAFCTEAEYCIDKVTFKNIDPRKEYACSKSLLLGDEILILIPHVSSYDIVGPSGMNYETEEALKLAEIQFFNEIVIDK